MKINLKKSGFSLLEMIIYISILTFMLAIIVEVVLSVTRSERTIKATRSVENSAVMTLERIGREVRAAQGVVESESVFGAHPGVLTLETTDENGNPQEIRFYLQDGKVILSIGEVVAGPLTEEKATVTSLKFFHPTSGNGEAIRTEIEVESGTSTYYRKEKFYSASALR